MKTLQEYYAIIDSSEFDGLTDESVIGLLPKLSPDDADFKNTVLENTAFLIRKSLNIQEDPENRTVRGLSWRYQGKNVDEQGNETNFYVPDVMALTQQDYEYFEQRFLTCSRLFPRIGIDINTKRFMTDNFHCIFVSIPRIIIQIERHHPAF